MSMVQDIIDQQDREIERLRDALYKLIEAADDSDGVQYGTLGTSFVRDIARAALVQDRPSELDRARAAADESRAASDQPSVRTAILWEREYVDRLLKQLDDGAESLDDRACAYAATLIREAAADKSSA